MRLQHEQSESASLSFTGKALLSAVVGGAVVSLVVYARETDLLQVRHISGRHAEAFSHEPIPIGHGLSGWVAENRRAIVNGNPTVEPNLRDEQEKFTADSSTLSVPLSDGNGKLLGVLSVYSNRPAAFSSEDLRILKEIQPRFSARLRAVPPADLRVFEGSSL